MIKKECIGYVILSVALQVEYQSELVVYQVIFPHLLQLIADFFPKLWEPNGGDQDPRSIFSAPFDNINWVLFSLIRNSPIWILELLSLCILGVIQLGDSGFIV